MNHNGCVTLGINIGLKISVHPNPWNKPGPLGKHLEHDARPDGLPLDPR